MRVGVHLIFPSGPDGADWGGPPDHARRYVMQTLRAAAALQNATEFVLFHAPEESHGGEPFACVALESQRGGWFSRSSGLAKPLKQAVRAARVDVLLSPLQSADLDIGVPQVYFACDLRPWEEEPGVASGRIAHAAAFRKACAESRALVVPSNYVRQRCLDLFDVPLNHTIVAPAGVPSAFAGSHSSMVAQPYLLMHDDHPEREKARRIVSALEKHASRFPYPVVLVGPGAEEGSELDERVVFIEHCPDAQLAGLYQQCAAFICCGRGDGGALHVIEALGAGCCVIAPHSPATTDLVADGPFYYNPESTSSLLQALGRVLDQGPQERGQRVRHGKAIAARFTWEQTAWKLLSAFKRA